MSFWRSAVRCGGPEEGLRVPVHHGNVGVACGNGTEIDGKDCLRERASFDIGVRLHEVGPRTKGSRVQGFSPSFLEISSLAQDSVFSAVCRASATSISEIWNSQPG